MKLFTIVKKSSSRVIDKNFQLISDFPLWRWTTQNLAGNGVDIYINTDSSEVIDECREMPGVIAYARSQKHIEWEKKSSSLGSPVEDMLIEFCQNHVPDKEELICLFHVTSPFIKFETIAQASAHVNPASGYKSVQSVKKIQDFLFFESDSENTPINFDPCKVQRTQDLQPVYMSLGAFFIAKAHDILRQRTRVPVPTFNYCLDALESIEIDYPDQLLLAQRIARELVL